MIKSGFAAIIGLPNSGKSTLLNGILGTKISITTKKPQTTRKSTFGILSEEDYQIIFLDTPGILKPEYLLQEKMLEYVVDAVKDADVLVFIEDISNNTNSFIENEFVSDVISKTNKPKMLALNKVDLVTQDVAMNAIKKYEETGFFNKVIPISAELKLGIKEIIPFILEHLPEHPKYYPDDDLSNESERFFVSEIIREKIFEEYSDEIPYSSEVIIVDFKEKPDHKDLIVAEIIVERDSQKGIIIGKGGEKIKRVGKFARINIEKLLEREVYLDLRVKVRDKWRSDAKTLKSFGYIKED